MSESAPTQPEIIAIVPAAGIGSRMQAERPKQYLILGQQTLLEHTLAALFAHPRITRAIIVISATDTYFPQLPLAQDPRIQVVIGGGLRADSVLAGLLAAENADWALVHDAARPCLHLGDLDRLLALTTSGAVGGILASPVSDTMKRAQPGNQSIDHTVERQDLWHALTPQLFPLPLLIQCLQQAMAEGATVTDEASALEHCGYQPQLVQGRADNIKVTRPEDLALAAFYLTQLSNKERI